MRLTCFSAASAFLSPSSISPGRVRRVVLAACLLPCAAMLAQTSPATPPDAPAASQQAPTTATANPIQGSVALFQLLQQKSVVFPDLATSNGPLSSWQKFKLAANNSVALSTIGAAAIGAGFSQAINTPSGYHQGAEGYGKRLGANMARAASDNMFSTFLLASALHQDPRFYVEKDLSFKESVKYAAVRVFITRSDTGERQFNYSGLIGPLAAEGLANAYYPDENRTAGETLTRYASDLGWRFGGNLLREYWPSINKKLRLVPTNSASDSK